MRVMLCIATKWAAYCLLWVIVDRNAASSRPDQVGIAPKRKQTFSARRTRYGTPAASYLAFIKPASIWIRLHACEFTRQPSRFNHAES